MATNGIGNLSTLIKRLEAATSRLEDIAVHGSSSAAGSGVFVPAAAVAAPPAVPAAAETVAAAAAPSSAPPVEGPPAVTAWDESVGEALKEYETLSAKLGGVVNEQAAAVVATFVNVRSVILTAAACTKPSGGTSSPLFAELLKPLQTSLVTVGELRDKNRGDKTFFNHLSTVSEGIPAVGWVAVDPKPGPFVAEMRDSAQFYANRVIKDHKDTDKVHVEWCRAYIKTLETMREYVMKTHTTGLVWNPKGGDLASYRPGPPATAGPPVGAPPPPPPPPGPPAPPPPPPPAAAAGDTGAGGMDAVFSQLNKGEGITAGLKKVDASQMTHKNPALREAGAPVSAAAKSKAAPPRPGAKPAALRPKKPPKTALEGNKWAVEFHEDDGNIVIGETELSQTVHIFGCKNSVITIKGKVNAVALVSCVKTSVLLDTLVSSLEITSSPSFTVQVTGHTPTILIDSCDSGQVYLSRTGLDAEIVTAKCSAINISVPGEGEEDEYRERALPEQLRHRIVNGKVVTDVVAHSG